MRLCYRWNYASTDLGKVKVNVMINVAQVTEVAEITGGEEECRSSIIYCSITVLLSRYGESALKRSAVVCSRDGCEGQ